MIKHLFLLLTACMMGICTANAQAVGSWMHFSSYGGVPAKIIDTPEKVFTVSQNRLTVYDKEADELMAYSKENYLTDSKVSNIFYNTDRHFAVVIYENGNIDLVHDDGKVCNLPEIRDMELNSIKRIRDISFNDDLMYLACEFGLVVMDTKRLCVVESVMTDNPLIAAFVIDGNLIICANTYSIFSSPADIRHYSMSQFTKWAVGGGHDAIAAIGNRSYYSVEGGILLRYTVNDSFDNYSRETFPVWGINDKFTRMTDGSYFISGTNAFAICGTDGNVRTYPMPELFSGNLISSVSGPQSIWMAAEQGISQYRLDTESQQLTMLTGASRPSGLSCGTIGQIHMGQNGYYFVSLEPSNEYNISQDTRSYIDYKPFDSNSFVNIYPKDLPHTASSYPGDKSLMSGNYRVTECPGEPGNFLVGNFFEGIYKMDIEGNVIGKYDYTNSTIISRLNGYYNAIADQAFDREGNLWALAFALSPPVLHMLPAAAFKAGTTTAADWKTADLGSYEGQKQGRMLICKKSNMILIAGQNGILGYDTKGTLTDLSDDEYVYRVNLTDQDGLSLESYYYIPMTEDHNGKVWIGHQGGVIEIPNPANFNNADFHINHIKVPRNDGTSLADYLLEGMRVTSIAVDASNRKWIGTNISGLYLVNENGSEVLAHFTTDNSDIPSDCVYEVFCDAMSNRVYVGTDVGLAVYSADAAPAAEDYSDVYAYPNPVRPDYTGLITVTGLMDNSLVKIADAAGNVFFSGRSEGGMITWDGCNSAGRRVKTGVYFVYASHSDGDGFSSSSSSSSSSGAVTKILVVN